VNVTFQEFYEKTGIELHFIVTELNKFQTIDFSHKTHPTQPLIEACYMSCCYPFGFTPVYRNDCCYIDGGIINDYPVNECIRDQKCGLAEILGVKMLWERKPANLTEKSSVIQFISTFFNQIKANLFENRPTKAIPNEVVCVSKVFSAQDWMNWMKDENYRRELVLRGETYANVFMSYRRNFMESGALAHAPEIVNVPIIPASFSEEKPESVPSLLEPVPPLDSVVNEPELPLSNTESDATNQDVTMV
jgi:hypothetical protein